MYVTAALTLSAATTAAMPYFQLGSIGPIQSFGIIVAAGVLIGAALLRRYAEWHGISDDHIRSLLGWVTICGFLGAHEFDMIAYNWDKIGEATNAIPPSWWFLPTNLYPSNWPLPLRLWEGISSYGGFLGGAMGFAFYVWWKRLPGRLFADITIVGLLPAFSIGRIGCTVVSDHIGAAIDPTAWYSFLAMDYPREYEKANSGIAYLFKTHPGAGDVIPAWNLGLIEFLYLVPVNLLLLWIAFRPARRSGEGDKPKWIGRTAAGLVTALAGVMYAPVRFFLDYLRPENSDPRHFGFTFAQWASLLAFGSALYLAARLIRTGKPEETITRTARDAQEQLRVVLNEDEEAKVVGKKPEPKRVEKVVEVPITEPPSRTAAKSAVKDDDDDDDDDGDDEDDKVNAKVEAKAAPVAPRRDPNDDSKAGIPKEARFPVEVSEPFIREQIEDEDEEDMDDEDLGTAPPDKSAATASPATAKPKPAQPRTQAQAKKPGAGGGGNKSKSKGKKKGKR